MVLAKKTFCKKKMALFLHRKMSSGFQRAAEDLRKALANAFKRSSRNVSVSEEIPSDLTTLPAKLRPDQAAKYGEYTFNQDLNLHNFKRELACRGKLSSESQTEAHNTLLHVFYKEKQKHIKKMLADTDENYTAGSEVQRPQAKVEKFSSTGHSKPVASGDYASRIQSLKHTIDVGESKTGEKLMGKFEECSDNYSEAFQRVFRAVVDDD